MTKSFIIILKTIFVFLLSFLFGDAPVTITGTFPSTSKVATEFVAEIKINKGNIAGFAKLQLEIPAGFIVKELDSKNGSFSLGDKIAKIVWTAIPSDPEFTVKFAITTDTTALGLRTINSKFSYINNNAKEVVEMTPVNINVVTEITEDVAVTSTTNTEITNSESTKTEAANPSVPAVAAVLAVPVIAATNASATKEPITENHAEPDSKIACTRAIKKGLKSNEYIVEVTIEKGSVSGFAKYQELLPVGFTAVGGKLNGSSFSISDGKAKFVWVSLPVTEALVVSYTLSKGASAANDAKLENGEFSYLENEQSKKYKLPSELIDIAPANEASSKPAAVAAAPVVAAAPIAHTEPVKKTETSPVITAKTESKATNTKELTAKKEGTVLYSVQVGAFKKAIKSDVLSKKYNITENIKSEMTQGYNKFMVGVFEVYQQAHGHRETIKQKGCGDAFVVAYNGAKRITVQEALMITNQKWFK